MKFTRAIMLPDPDEDGWPSWQPAEEIQDKNLRFRTRGDLREGFLGHTPMVELRLPFDEPDCDGDTSGVALRMIVVSSRQIDGKLTEFEGFVGVDQKRDPAKYTTADGLYKGEPVYRDHSEVEYRKELWVFRLGPEDFEK